MSTPRFCLCTAAAAGLVLAPLAAADDPRIDPKTGAEMANYPPDRHFDHIHMLLELDIPDMSKPFLRGVETLTAAAVGRERDWLVLDAGADIAVESVSVGGKPQAFTHENRKLSIALSPPVRIGEQVQVRIAYKVEYPKADGTGLTWTPGRASANNATDKAPQIHSQGQPGHNHAWFPCHDFPNERLSTELIVTVEDGFIVGSNGRLVGTRYAGNEGGQARTRWHWLQEKPHSPYLVSMIVGKFAIVGLPGKDEAGTPRDGAGRPLPNYLYTPIGTEQSAARAYGKTPAMIVHFEKLFDEPYPWDKYSQALVRSFAAGGMENTSATTMQAGSARAPAGSQDRIIAHELVHQWFGDLITCNAWEHGWLNEGWASFGEALWAEADTSKGKKQAYQGVIAGFLSAQRVLNRTYAPLFPPLVSNRYGDPMQTFMKPNDIYAKGAIVLHMLRQGLGDEVFFRGVRAYIDRHKLGTVETDHFRHCLEEASGMNLERFFQQWCFRPGMPRLELQITWQPSESGAGTLRVTAEQSQRIDADNPAYVFRLPLLVKGESGPGTYVYLDIDSKSNEASFPLEAKPKDVVVDPNLTVTAVTTVKKSLAMWLEQADDDSVFAQLQAAEHLADFAEPEAAAALARLASDPDRQEPAQQAAGLALAQRYRDELTGLARAVARVFTAERRTLAQEVAR